MVYIKLSTMSLNNVTLKTLQNCVVSLKLCLVSISPSLFLCLCVSSPLPLSLHTHTCRHRNRHTHPTHRTRRDIVHTHNSQTTHIQHGQTPHACTHPQHNIHTIYTQLTGCLNFPYLESKTDPLHFPCSNLPKSSVTLSLKSV